MSTIYDVVQSGTDIQTYVIMIVHVYHIWCGSFRHRYTDLCHYDITCLPYMMCSHCIVCSSLCFYVIFIIQITVRVTRFVFPFSHSRADRYVFISDICTFTSFYIFPYMYVRWFWLWFTMFILLLNEISPLKKLIYDNWDWKHNTITTVTARHWAEFNPVSVHATKHRIYNIIIN